MIQKTSFHQQWVHIFLKGISPEVNVIVRQDFELAYNKAAVGDHT